MVIFLSLLIVQAHAIDLVEHLRLSRAEMPAAAAAELATVTRSAA